MVKEFHKVPNVLTRRTFILVLHTGRKPISVGAGVSLKVLEFTVETCPTIRNNMFLGSGGARVSLKTGVHRRNMSDC